MKQLLTAVLSVMCIAMTYAQCDGFDKFPGGAEEGKAAHIVYRDYMKAKDYANAFTHWEKVFATSPGGSQFHYLDGAALYMDKFQKETDPALKETYKQKVLEMHDGRTECFAKAKKNFEDCRLRKAHDMYYYLRTDYKDTYATYKEAFTTGNNTISHYYFDAFTDVLLYLFQSQLITKEDALESVNRMNEIIDYNVANNKTPSEVAQYQAKKASLDTKLAPVAPYLYGCDYITEQATSKWDASAKDKTAMLAARDEVYAFGCTASPFYKTIDSLLQETSIVAKAQKAYKAKQYDEAIALYDKAIATEENVSTKADLTLRKAYAQYGKGSYSAARTSAYAAGKLKANWGDPYILIGTMYASSGKRCGSGTGWDSQVVTWAAIDKWYYAKSIDPNSAAKANELIGKYSKYMPTRTDIFQRGFKEGQAYKVGCWIGESTKIKAR